MYTNNLSKSLLLLFVLCMTKYSELNLYISHLVDNYNIEQAIVLIIQLSSVLA